MSQLKRDAGGVVAQLGDGLREPAIDRAVHQQEAEEEHEKRRRERKQDGADEHPRTQPRAEDTAAFIGKKLEDISQKKNEEGDEEQEDDDRKSGEEEDLSAGIRVQEAKPESIQRAKY
jgi:hypothetical protein